MDYCELPLSNLSRNVLFCTVLQPSSRSEGWPHHGRTFSIYLCPLSFWLTLPWRVLTMSWCCSSRPYVAFLAFVHLTLFLALSYSPGSSLVSSWCDHSMLASLLWQCLTVPSTPALLRTHSFVFYAVYETRIIFLSPFISCQQLKFGPLTDRACVINDVIVLHCTFVVLGLFLSLQS